MMNMAVLYKDTFVILNQEIQISISKSKDIKQSAEV